MPWFLSEAEYDGYYPRVIQSSKKKRLEGRKKNKSKNYGVSEYEYLIKVNNSFFVCYVIILYACLSNACIFLFFLFPNLNYNLHQGPSLTSTTVDSTVLTRCGTCAIAKLQARQERTLTPT